METEITSLRGKHCTFVTGYFDIHRYGKHQRSSYAYIRLFEKIVKKMKYPLLVYIEPQNEAKVISILEKYAEARWKVVVKEIQDIDIYKYKDKTDGCKPFENKSFRDNLHFFMVMWAKPSLMVDAIEHNYFDTKYYAWIDLGVAHVCHFTLKNFDDIVVSISDKVKFCQIFSINPKIIKDRAEYYRLNRCNLAAGLFTGSREELIKFKKLFDIELELVLSIKRLCVDEQIISVLVARYPERFEYYYGTHSEIICNYRYITSRMDVLINNLTDARNHQLNKQGVDIYNKIIESQIESTIRLSAKNAVGAIREGYICAYYIDKEKAKEIAKVVPFLYKYCELFKREIDSGNDSDKKLWNDNLSYVGYSLEGPLISEEEFFETKLCKPWLCIF